MGRRDPPHGRDYQHRSGVVNILRMVWRKSSGYPRDYDAVAPVCYSAVEAFPLPGKKVVVLRELFLFKKNSFFIQNLSGSIHFLLIIQSIMDLQG
jgi:hypothetical protein